MEPRRPLCGLIFPRRGDRPVQMADRDGQVASEPRVLRREREDAGAIDTDQLAGPGTSAQRLIARSAWRSASANASASCAARAASTQATSAAAASPAASR